jgi:hypothetical protein
LNEVWELREGDRRQCDGKDAGLTVAATLLARADKVIE